MSLKPDHTAADLRALMDQFATAAEPASPAEQANRIRQQLTEMDYGGGRSPHAGMGLPRDDLDGDIAGRKEIMVKPETAKNTVKSIGDRLDQAFAQAYNDKGVAENDVSALAGFAAGTLGGAVLPFAAGSLAVAFRDALHRTDDLAKRRARVDTAEIVALQRQIVSINKMLGRVKTDETKEKYQAMLKKAYKLLDDLKARQGNQVSGEFEGELDSKDRFTKDTVQKMFGKLSPDAKGVSEVSGIGSNLPKSDIETFGLQKGRPYKINPPQDFKPGDRKRAVQQLIPTQDKKDHIRSRLGKHVAPALPESDMEEGVAEHSMYGDEEVSWEKGGRRAPTGAFRNPAVVKTDKSIGTRVSDTGPGNKEYNVKTDKEWDKQKGVAEGRAGVDDTDTVGFSVNSETAYNAVMKRFGNAIDLDETSGIMYAPARIWPRIEMTAFDADPESGAVRVEDDVMEQGVVEAKSLARRVRVVKTGETGTIRQIKHGAYKGAPKTYYVDLDNGGQADNLPAGALRLIKGAVAEVKSKTHPEKSEMDTPAVQGAIARMRQRHEKEPFDLEKAQALGQKLAARNRDPRRK